VDALDAPRVRPAVLADLFWLRLLLGQLFEEMPAAYPSPTIKDLEAQTAVLAARLGSGDPNLLCYVAEHESVIVGFMLGDFLTRIGRPRSYLFLSFFYVVPSFRGKGVGRALSENMLRVARDGDTEVCEFVAQAGDKQWRKRGWATVGIVHSLPVDAAAASLAVADRDHPNGDAKDETPS